MCPYCEKNSMPVWADCCTECGEKDIPAKRRLEKSKSAEMFKIKQLKELIKEVYELAVYFQKWKWSNNIREQLKYENNAKRLEEIQKLLNA